MTRPLYARTPQPIDVAAFRLEEAEVVQFKRPLTIQERIAKLWARPGAEPEPEPDPYVWVSTEQLIMQEANRG